MRDTRSAVALSDTSSKASQVYFQRLAARSPAERVRLGAALWEAAHSLQWAAARRKYPDADDPEIAFQVAVTRFGAELARAAYGKA
jgi:hypothetical protein